MKFRKKFLEEFKEYPFEVALKRLLARYLLARIFSIIPDRYFLMNYCGGKIYLDLKEYNPSRYQVLGVYEYWKTRLFVKTSCFDPHSILMG